MVYQQYQDPSTARYLKFGYWYESHKYVLYKSTVIFLVVINVGLWAVAGYKMIMFASQSKNHSELMRELAAPSLSVEEIHQANEPEELVIRDVFAVQGIGAGTTADFAAIVENPNDKWVIEADYKFSWPGGETITNTGTILPGKETLLVAQGASLSEIPVSPELVLARVAHHRVKDEKLKLRAEEASSGLSISNEMISQEADSTRAVYTVANLGPYVILDPSFAVLVMRYAGAPEALGISQMAELNPGDVEQVEIRWLRLLSGASEVRVYPLINFFDSEIYRLPDSRPVSY